MVQALPGPEQAWDGNTMRLGSMLLDTPSGACIAPCAVIQIQDENTLAFIETLGDIVIEDAMTHSPTAQTS